MQEENDATPAIATTPETASEHPLAKLAREEEGNVLLEYVTLLICVFLSVYVMIEPLHDALMQYAGWVFHHLHYA